MGDAGASNGDPQGAGVTLERLALRPLAWPHEGRSDASGCPRDQTLRCDSKALLWVLRVTVVEQTHMVFWSRALLHLLGLPCRPCLPPPGTMVGKSHVFRTFPAT